MTAGRPQDRLPKRIAEATAQQAANLAQKAIIDNVVVKFTRIIGTINALNSTIDKSRPAGKGLDEQEQLALHEEAIEAIRETLKMTRDEVAEIRLQPEHTFPDERVQAILTRAVDEITDAILSDVV